MDGPPYIVVNGSAGNEFISRLSYLRKMSKSRVSVRAGLNEVRLRLVEKAELLLHARRLKS